MSKEKRELRYQLTELRAAAEGEGRTITGRAVVFDEWSKPIGRFREKIAPQAFAGCNMDDAILCLHHDERSLLGRISSGTLKIEVRADGLYFECDAPNTTLGNDTLEMMRRGDITECSFCFRVEEDSWREMTPENGLQYHERTIMKISYLGDVALVVRPAYDKTDASVRSLDDAYSDFVRLQNPTRSEEQEQRSRRQRIMKILTLK